MVEGHLQLLLGEVGRELLNGLNEIVALNATIGSILRWSDLEKWTILKTDDLSLAAGIRTGIPLGKDVKQGQPDSGLESEEVSNGVWLHGGGPIVPTSEEGTEGIPDSATL